MKPKYPRHTGSDGISTVFRILRRQCGLDFSGFTFATSRLLLQTYLKDHGLAGLHPLADKLKSHSGSPEQLVEHLDYADSEMFRDPHVWKLLFDSVLPGAMAGNERIRCWFPGCSSGEELFSFTILASERGLLNRMEIVATSMSQHRLKTAATGQMDKKSVDLSAQNYLQAGGKKSLSDYIRWVDGIAMRDTAVISDVTFELQEVCPGIRPGNWDMIIYRNRLNCFTVQVQQQITRELADSLKKGGILIIGQGERIIGQDTVALLQQAHDAGRIFRKKQHE